ncbi:hypothetical protein DL766_007156 [Monosporascus sp. MC13-8B]|uniref:Uncharacterized protein n=1 Tax=Monosporascus cannonballus TaxID=155416 RepID=A0ABY0GZC3_9PEZI|nr:hypothetical protein DL762_007667 [Monosporascus cannonballus]RYP25063.1 hypothetical protein DL766_007156 [Monosporascus sp. MC13-8B]
MFPTVASTTSTEKFAAGVVGAVELFLWGKQGQEQRETTASSQAQALAQELAQEKKNRESEAAQPMWDYFEARHQRMPLVAVPEVVGPYNLDRHDFVRRARKLTEKDPPFILFCNKKLSASAVQFCPGIVITDEFHPYKGSSARNGTLASTSVWALTVNATHVSSPTAYSSIS